MRKIMEISGSHGLHARPVLKFVEQSKAFESSVYLEKAGKRVNGKSFMEIVAAGMGPGDTVTLETLGPDEEQAMQCLSEALLRLADED